MLIFKPLLSPERPPTEAQRFWARVGRGHPMDCWEWAGKTTPNGYGWASHFGGGKGMLAHRAAFLVSGGRLIAGLVIMHRCDNRLCCNPAHLSQGTYAENIRDSVAKGRFTKNRPRGSRYRTHCGRGHEMSGRNVYTYVYAFRNSRACKECKRLYDKKRSARKAAPASSPPAQLTKAGEWKP